MTQNRRDDIKLWRDNELHGGMEILRASCYEHSYPPHFHDEFVIAAFARGAQRTRICRQKGVAAAGTVMVIMPGEVHTGEAVQRDEGWDYCAFYPSQSLINDVAETVLKGRGDVNFGTVGMRHDPRIARRMLHAAQVLNASDDPLEKTCVMYQILNILIGNYGERTVKGARQDVMRADIRKAIEFLHSCYAQALTVKEIATVAGLSEFYFMRTFQAMTGLSVHQYLTQTRLVRAKGLLSRGISASQVASDVGFFDQSHLIKHFRAHFGTTPGLFAAASA
ncbi:AraC family transcriptional regulator [Phytobacter diazotrophicus]|uniref:AraC family transcriptional regulator n=1 Tax=Phytobacter diazotrophicus TaxID=395631 RepID=UPI00232AAEBD|nr:AraC family transcriptional regulator [Phytobacter diazotrophicus]MDC0728656.1 AraC family transcriptional regulator [Phytobacter diazotrophicus]MDC0735890.1 AraC family transcriptional regulator [Phytobacter diazotrophicus]